MTSTNNIHSLIDQLNTDCCDFDDTQNNPEDEQNVMNDVDPDVNFYQRISCDCKYYQDCVLECTSDQKETMSIIHLNSRSVYANFDSIKM